MFQHFSKRLRVTPFPSETFTFDDDMPAAKWTEAHQRAILTKSLWWSLSCQWRKEVVAWRVGGRLWGIFWTLVPSAPRLCHQRARNFFTNGRGTLSTTGAKLLSPAGGEAIKVAFRPIQSEKSTLLGGKLGADFGGRILGGCGGLGAVGR